ncbi:MAG: tetratricopeptide repeat protein [Candidatus Limnocylindrales bacterium]
MTRPGLPASGPAAAATELLARLGLPTSASPEVVDELHQAVSQYLATAPSEIRGWAHAQAAALDEAYLLLTDPVGLEGSALMSPTRPPAVVPGGPATPPARRDSVRAAVPVQGATAAAVVGNDAAGDAGTVAPAGDEPDLTDLEVLYASVTPSAHRDMLPDQGTKPAQVAARATVRTRSRHRLVATPVTAPIVAPQGANPWKRLVIAGVAVIAVAGGVFGVYQMGAGSPAATDSNVAQATPTAPAVDQAKVADLMAKIQANPKDIVSLLALADEFYAGEQFAQAATFLDQLLAIEPENIQALLARGAVSFNLGDLDAAEATWKKVVAIDPKNAEVHYDLGFLYLNQPAPDWAGVQREWNLVIELDPGSDLAKTVQSHLDSLVAASMLPGGSLSPGGSASAAPSITPSASPAASASQTAGASPAASTVP